MDLNSFQKYFAVLIWSFCVRLNFASALKMRSSKKILQMQLFWGVWTFSLCLTKFCGFKKLFEQCNSCKQKLFASLKNLFLSSEIFFGSKKNKDKHKSVFFLILFIGVYRFKIKLQLLIFQLKNSRCDSPHYPNPLQDTPKK